MLTNVYASNSHNSRKTFQDEVIVARSMILNVNWIVLGDFNMPLYPFERQGRNMEVLDITMDLHSRLIQGGSYTWSNMWTNYQLIQVKHDIYLLFYNWVILNDCSNSFVVTFWFDHQTIQF